MPSLNSQSGSHTIADFGKVKNHAHSPHESRDQCSIWPETLNWTSVSSEIFPMILHEKLVLVEISILVLK